MQYTYKDKGEFLRAFLILIRKDKIINESEKQMTLVIGKYFGFEKRFCEDAISHLLENEFLSENPPKFSSQEIARFFIKESLHIMEQIKPLNEDEKDWLVEIAKSNNLNDMII
jgi:hypothetical protein